MKTTALLIDDEYAALRTLQGMLQEYFPQVEVVATAASIDEAFRLAKLHLPDVVFLDIQMPPFGTGFDFLEKCRGMDFGVIFTTAYPDYAVQAINSAQPWAYLVKPYSVAKLEKAVATAAEKLSAARTAEGEAMSIQRIVVPDGRKGNIVIRVLDIEYCKADGATAEVFFWKDGALASIVASRTLKDIEEQLPGSQFCRCHHSYVVNLGSIERFERTGRNGAAHLQSGEQVPVSVGKMEDFAARFRDFLRTS